jgi:pimeloyl-ACP methyl ester carboxylesterase
MSTDTGDGKFPVANEVSRVRTNVYILHGLLGTCLLHCGPQIKAWRTRYRVIRIDLPGHGRCRADARYPYFANSLQFLHDVIARYGKGHVVGVSYLGGTLAVRAALRYPELLRSLVLTGYVSEVPQENFIASIQLLAKLAQRSPVMAGEYDQIHGPRWRTTLEIISQDCCDNYSSSIAVTDSMFVDLKVPTLVANGALKFDERITAANLPARNTLVEGGLIPGAGHLATYDQPDMFNLMVERFWEGHSAIDHGRSCGDIFS